MKDAIFEARRARFPGATHELALRAALLALALSAAGCGRSAADPDDPKQVALGREVYAVHCASCHGANLEGQPRWRERLPSGRLPAPPHDASGHTWHHADDVLIDITRRGMGPYAPPDYESDMPAFGDRLKEDEIRAVIAYIKSRWPAQIREKQAAISAARR